VELLHTLSVCLTDRCCRHYFINSCNLVHNLVNVEMAASKLMSVDEVCLSTWFVNTYIGKCAQLCPDYVLRLFDDAITITNLQNVVLEIAKFRIQNSLKDLWALIQFGEHILSVAISQHGLNVQSCVCWVNELTKSHIGLCLYEYFSAVSLLYTAYKISRNGLNDNTMDVLWTIFQFNDTPRYSMQQCSVTSVNKAIKLMKDVVANKVISTMQLIEIELSKAYLYRALGCKDSDSDSIYCLANVYLAVLYYTTEQYQTAIDHCTLVTRSQDHSQCSSHVVQGELLPKVDDYIDNVLGLTVFYQNVLSAAKNPLRQRQYISIFTTEMFAYYLHCKLLSMTQCHHVTQMSLADVSQQSAKYISEMHELFTGDVLLFKLLNSAMDQNDCNKPVTSDKAELDTPKLVELVQQRAVNI